MMTDEEYEVAKAEINVCVIENDLDGFPKLGSSVQVAPKPLHKKDPTFPKNILGKQGIVMAYQQEMSETLIVVRIGDEDHLLWKEEVITLLI